MPEVYTGRWSEYIDPSHDSPIFTPGSVMYKEFYTRFRVHPVMFYNTLLPWTMKYFEDKPDATGRRGIPVVLKLLGVLRILGRGLHFDDIADILGCGFKGEAIRTFFYEWCHRFVEDHLSTWVKVSFCLGNICI
jgi:hypothetical protein